MWVKKNFKYILLFAITFVTTTLAGLEWTTGKTIIADNCGFKWGGDVNWGDIKSGLMYSVPFLLILTTHEFGHYFTARFYKANVTLPLYIPLWFFGLSVSIGTMGAFISIRSPLKSTKEFFDVGVAGPIAGFIVALFIIVYGFATLPEPDYIYSIHPDYEQAYSEYGVGTRKVYTLEYQQEQYVRHQLECNPDAKPEPPTEFETFALGDNLLFKFFKWVFSYQGNKIPNEYEMFHYPFLFAGYLACFFTALNLIPIGQLDGGHVMYGLLGHKRFNKVSPYIHKAFMFYAGLGLITPEMTQSEMVWAVPLYIYFLSMSFRRSELNIKTRFIWSISVFLVQYAITYLFPTVEGYPGYLLFGLIIGMFLGVQHPPSLIEQDIGGRRKVIGWMAIAIFILCFPPQFFVL